MQSPGIHMRIRPSPLLLVICALNVPLTLAVIALTVMIGLPQSRITEFCEAYATAYTDAVAANPTGPAPAVLGYSPDVFAGWLVKLHQSADLHSSLACVLACGSLVLSVLALLLAFDWLFRTPETNPAIE